MAAKSNKIPYPPSPTVPEGFTEYADSFTKKQNFLLSGLFVFLIFYIAAVIFFAMIGIWCLLTFAKWPMVKVIGMGVSGVFFLYLVKGFFKRPPMNKEMHVEITEKDHPILFGFIDKLCDELGAPLPNKVYVSPDVNAACISRTSLINLFVEPKRDLLIGLGLVNCMNLSEFKAVLAHEFGHFCHLGPTNSYAYVVKGIIFDLVEGEDWFDRVINWCKRQKNAFALFGLSIGACLWLGRKILWWLLKTIALQDRALSREQEFHADKVAVSAAGSDASTHGLLRARFGMQCFIQAINDLALPARDHKIYTDDLYLHQDRAAAVVRREKKEPELGLPPLLPTPTSGMNIKVFDADEDEMEDQDDTPPMWRTHPSDADREENAKKEFIAAEMDHRSPWILFSGVADLKERMTYKFYRMEFRIAKDSDLTSAVKVQEYIDNEHAETTYDPKYHGAYDDRPLEPGSIDELNTIVHDSPWTEERLMKVYDKLYEGCREHAEAHADLHKELHSLKNNLVGKPTPKMKKMIAEVEKKLDTNWEWFKSFDRRVYLLHIQMATGVGREMRQELIERYRFQLEVQRFYQEARNNFNEADAYITAYGAASRGEIQVPRDFGAQVIAVLRAAWKALKKIVQDAREINLPAMKNFEEGERLADFILEGKMVPEPPLSELKGIWVQKLMNQLLGVKNRCFRLHFKSVGGVLAIQERIAAAWLAERRPIEAEVIPAEAIEAEVIPVEAIEAEVIPVDVVPAEVMDEVVAAEIIPIEVAPEPLPLEPLPAVPATATEPMGKPMAAFVSPPLPPSPPKKVPVTPPSAVTATSKSSTTIAPNNPPPVPVTTAPAPPLPPDPVDLAVPATTVSPLPVASYGASKTAPPTASGTNVSSPESAHSSASKPSQPDPVPPTPIAPKSGEWKSSQPVPVSTPPVAPKSGERKSSQPVPLATPPVPPKSGERKPSQPVPASTSTPSVVSITDVSLLPVPSYSSPKASPAPLEALSAQSALPTADSIAPPEVPMQPVTPDSTRPDSDTTPPSISAERTSPPEAVMPVDSNLQTCESIACKEELTDRKDLSESFPVVEKPPAPAISEIEPSQAATMPAPVHGSITTSAQEARMTSAPVTAPSISIRNLEDVIVNRPERTHSDKKPSDDADDKTEMMDLDNEENLQLRSLFEKARSNVNVTGSPAAAPSQSPSPAGSETQTQVLESQKPAENMGSLDSAPKDEVPSTTTTSMPKETPKPAEEIFSLDADDAPTPASKKVEEAPIPAAEEIFSLDADEAQPSGTQSSPVGEPIPAEEIFSLDADEFQSTSAAPAAAGEPIHAEKVFSLDADEIPVIEATPIEAEPIPAEEIPVEEIPAEAIAAEEIPVEEIAAEEIPAEEIPLEAIVAEEIPAEEIPAEEIISLDSDAIVAEVIEAEPAKPVSQKAPFGTVAQPAAVPVGQPQAKPPLSGTTSASRPAFGSLKPAAPEATEKSVTSPRPKRPAVRITMVKPGEKSPFGK